SSGTAVALVPVPELPTEARVDVRLPAGAPSAEGPLRTTADQAYGFTTHGPLKVVGHRCGWDPKRCAPGTEWSIELSNELATTDPTGLIRIDPPLPDADLWVNYREIGVRAWGRPRTTYTVTVGADVADVFGQRLGAPQAVTFTVGDAEPLRPQIAAAGPNLQVADPSAPPSARFLVAGLSKVRLRVSRVEASDLDAFSDRSWYDPDDRAPLPGHVLLDELRPVGVDPNVPSAFDVDLTRFLDGGHGHLLVEASTPPGTGRYDRQGQRVWVTATGIGVSTLTDADSVYVWATDLRTGRPIPGALVSGEGQAEPVATDDRGLAVIPPPARGPVRVRQGDDEALLTPTGYLYTDRVWGPGPGYSRAAWFIFDDRHLYRPSETVSIKGWIRTVDMGRGGDVAPPGDIVGNVDWAATDAMGVELARGTAALDGWGGFDLKIALPDTPNLGPAQVAFELRSGDTSSWSFDIQEFRRPEFEVSAQVETAGPHVVGGEAVIAAHASYFAGGPLPGADAAWTVTARPGEWHPAGWDEWRFGRWE
ncbi:MAG TPA: MG2 domain-containing protein, partial [Microthrixaceae bacterium]|nr:MG2 domain-containing protein [Microthrixaceae bacterium]